MAGAHPSVQPAPGYPFVFCVVLPSLEVQQREVPPLGLIGSIGLMGSVGCVGGVSPPAARAHWHVRMPMLASIRHCPVCPIGHGRGHCEAAVQASCAGMGGGG